MRDVIFRATGFPIWKPFPDSEKVSEKKEWSWLKKEHHIKKNNIVYALNVPVDQPIGLHSTRYRLIYYYHNETWMVKAFKDLLTE